MFHLLPLCTPGTPHLEFSSSQVTGQHLGRRQHRRGQRQHLGRWSISMQRRGSDAGGGGTIAQAVLESWAWLGGCWWWLMVDGWCIIIIIIDHHHHHHHHHQHHHHHHHHHQQQQQQYHPPPKNQDLLTPEWHIQKLCSNPNRSHWLSGVFSIGTKISWLPNVPNQLLLQDAPQQRQTRIQNGSTILGHDGGCG